MNSDLELEVVGLIPAAGFARRLGAHPTSKEVMPVAAFGGPPRPVSEYLLDAFGEASIDRVCWVTRKEKQDIQRCFGSRWGDMQLEYHHVQPTRGAPFTLDAIHEHVRGAVCALGWPDILLPQCDAYRRLRQELRVTGADVVLGLFPTPQPSAVDVVEADDGRVHTLHIKSNRPVESPLTWGPAVWRPSFTSFMHACLLDESKLPAEREPHVGDLFTLAIAEGLHVASVQLSDQPCVDVGTPEGLQLLERLS